MENYYYLCFRANAQHLTLRVRLLAITAAFDFRKCKRLLLSSLAVSALYRGPRGILCTRWEKEYASIRQPTAACDNRLVKNEAYDDSPRKFICAEDVDGQKVTLTGLLTAHTALLKSHCRGDNAHSYACVRLFPTGTQYPAGSPITALLKSHFRRRQCSLFCLCVPFPHGYTVSRGVPYFLN